jgi:hypothetical protein
MSEENWEALFKLKQNDWIAACKEIDLERSRLAYVLGFFEDHIDDIQCRGDEDCDHCVIKAMVKDSNGEYKP